jgi:hypothetical protein
MKSIVTVIICAVLFAPLASAKVTELRLILPEKIAFTASRGQTDFLPTIEILNQESAPLEIDVFDDGDHRSWFHGIDFKLFDNEGKEISGGFLPTENFAGSRFRKVLAVEPGESIRLPYYRTVPFQIRSTGVYDLVAFVTLQDKNGVWHKYPAVHSKLTVK